MSEEHFSDRWGEIRGIHREYANFYRMLRGGVIIGLFVIIGWSVFQESDEPRAFGMNLWTEIAGIAVTVLIIDLLNEMRAERRYKQQLVDEAASTSNETAKHAVHVMRRRGWLIDGDGLLNESHLYAANLSEAQLQMANLQNSDMRYSKLVDAKLAYAKLQNTDLRCSDMQNADLYSANLVGASLEDANLQNTRLSLANFERANLLNADLSGAVLSYTNLQFAKLGSVSFKRAELIRAKLKGATMWGANLQGANLYFADLEGINLRYVSFDTETRLPDGQLWDPEIDLTRYTEVGHPEYWKKHEMFSLDSE